MKYFYTLVNEGCNEVVISTDNLITLFKTLHKEAIEMVRETNYIYGIENEVEIVDISFWITPYSENMFDIQFYAEPLDLELSDCDSHHVFIFKRGLLQVFKEKKCY